MTKLHSLIGVAATALALASTAAHADTTWKFTFTGNGISANGSFETSGDGSSPAPVVSITGTYSDATIANGTIAGVVALNTDGGFNYDNQFGGTPWFSNAGLLFDVGGQHVNLYSQDGSFYDAAWEQPGLLNEVVTLSVAPVPEPGSIAMLLAGIGALGIAGRRKARA